MNGGYNDSDYDINDGDLKDDNDNDEDEDDNDYKNDKDDNGDDDWTDPLWRQYAGEATVRAGERQ